MKSLFFTFSLVVSLSLNTFASDIQVVDVKRNITLANDDVVYKDFYLNAGDGSALRKNLVVNVKRKVTVKESATKSIGDFETTIGQLKIIHVGNKVSVAREFKITSRDEEPVVEQIGIMSGDRIDLAGSFIDYSKPNYKKPSAELSSTPEATKSAATDSTTSSPVATEAVPTATEKATPSAATPPTATPPPTKPSPATAKTEEVTARVPANDAKNEPSLFEKIIPLPKAR